MKNDKIFNSWNKIKIPEGSKNHILYRVLNNTGNDKKGKINIFRTVLILSCSVILICAIIVNLDIEREIKTTDKTLSININKIGNYAQTQLDADIHECKITNIDIKNIIIPTDMKLERISAIYVRPDNMSKTYNLLHDIVIQYNNIHYDKTIIVAVSKEGRPLRDYYLGNEKLEQSIIDNIPMVISNLNNMYIVTFELEDIYYDIETEGINQEELIKILKSILQNDLEQLLEKEKNTKREYKILEQFEVGEPRIE